MRLLINLFMKDKSLFLSMMFFILFISIFLLADIRVYAQNTNIDVHQLTYVYYNPSQEDGVNTFLQQSADELKTHLAKTGVTLTIQQTANPTGTGIYLQVNPNDNELVNKKREAFKLLTQNGSIYIIGKTPVAVRHGTYTVLEKLGFRWYFIHPMWHVIPSTLPTLTLNEVQEPFFISRDMRAAVGELIGGANGLEYQKEWFQKNRMYGDEKYTIRHSWPSFANKSDPTIPRAALCFKPDGITPQQVLPEHPEIINRANTFASNWFSTPLSSPPGLWLDTPTEYSVPISPPDGNAIWCDEWQEDVDNDGDLDYSPQVITDKTMFLTNEVAKTLPQGKYAGVYSYSWYSEVPSYPLDPRVYVQITDFTRGTTKATRERMQAFKNKGVMTGFYGYFDVWPWWHDRIDPAYKWQTFYTSLKDAVETDTDTFYFEASSNWGPKGRLYWLMSQLMWDPYQGTENVDTAIKTLLDDFYTHAFGPAKDVMKRFYERFDTQSQTTRVMGLAFQDLEEALQFTQNYPQEQERVWFVFYHTYFWWKWRDPLLSYNFSSLDQAKEVEKFLTKTSSLQLVSSKLQRLQVVEPALRNFGLTDAEITNLQDTTLYTNSERQAMLSEALSAWSGQNLLDVGVFDPIDYQPFTPAGNTILTKLRRYKNSYGDTLKVFVPSSGNETITAIIVAEGTYQWINPQGAVIREEKITNMCVDGAGCYPDQAEDATNTFNLSTTSPGLYQLHVIGDSSVGIKDHAASIANHNFTQQAKFDTYFYVPENTNAFLVGGYNERTNKDPLNLIAVEIKLTDPSGTIQTFQGPYGVQNEWGIQNPQSGVWRLQGSFPSNIGGGYWIYGFPVFVWNDPKYLLVPTMNNIFGDVNNSGKVNILDISFLLSNFGQSNTQFDLDNSDGLNIINFKDISILLSNFGQ